MIKELMIKYNEYARFIIQMGKIFYPVLPEVPDGLKDVDGPLTVEQQMALHRWKEEEKVVRTVRTKWESEFCTGKP